MPLFKVSVRPDPKKLPSVIASYADSIVEEGRVPLPEYPGHFVKVKVTRNSGWGQIAVEVAEADLIWLVGTEELLE